MGKWDLKGRPDRREGKKCPVDTFLGRGRIHIPMNASGTDVGMRILFVVVGYRNCIYSVYKTQKKCRLRAAISFVVNPCTSGCIP